MNRSLGDFNYSELVLLMTQPAEVIDFLIYSRLLPEKSICVGCGEAMKLCLPSTDRGEEGRWRCFKKRCLKEKSVQSGSFLQKQKLCLKILVTIMFLWGKGQISIQIQTELKILAVSVDQWLHFLRELIDDHFFFNT